MKIFGHKREVGNGKYYIMMKSVILLRVVGHFQM